MGQINNNILGNTLGRTTHINVIQTDNLNISGHLLRWEDVVIQISNISMISTAELQKVQFPFISVALIFIGLVLIKLNFLLTVIFIGIGGFLIYAWYSESQRTKDFKYLHIHLNSGRAFSILFENPVFLNRVLNIFAEIFEDGGQIVSGDIHIDIRNCNVDNNSSIINTINEIK